MSQKQALAKRRRASTKMAKTRVRLGRYRLLCYALRKLRYTPVLFGAKEAWLVDLHNSDGVWQMNTLIDSGPL